MAIKTMHSQVGDLILDKNNIAVRGLIVRHLIMPNGLADTEKWLEFIAKEISQNTYLNIMDQYRPCGDANNFPELCKTISYNEYEQAIDMARKFGLTNLDKRDISKLYILLNRM